MSVALLLIALALIAFLVAVIGVDRGKGVPVGLFLLTLLLLIERL